MKRFLIPLLLFFVAISFFTVKVSAAPSFTSVTVYVWWQGDGNFTPTQVLVGDRVMLQFVVSSFTRIYNPVVKDPQGNTLPVKNSTWTVSPYYLWFNTTSLAGQYTVQVTANDTSTNTKTTYTGYIMVYSYQMPTAILKGADVNGAIADLYTLPTINGNISASATFFSLNANGSVTATVSCSAATPFMLKLMSGSKQIYATSWIHPKGVQTVSVTFQYPISNSTMSLLGANNFVLQVVPYYGTAPSVSLGTVYFIPAEDFTKSNVAFSASYPSSAKVGDLFNLTPSLVLSNNAKTIVSGTPAYPVVLSFNSPLKSAVMWPSDAKGRKLLVLNATNNRITKFVGSLPDIGTNSIEIYPVSLKSFLAGQFNKMIDQTGKYIYASGSVKILPDGTFSLSLLNSSMQPVAKVHPSDVLYMNVTWTRNNYWIYSGDSYSISVVGDTEIGSYPYHKGIASISASNGTTVKASIRLDPVNKTYTSLSASATPYLRLKTGETLASIAAVPYEFAGYNIKFLLGNMPYTPPASAPLLLRAFDGGIKIYEGNVTSAYIYLYASKGPLSITAESKPTAASKISGSASATGDYGKVTDVVISLSAVSLPAGPYEYVPEPYTGTISVVIKADLQSDTVYTLFNNLTAITDIVANSPAVSAIWNADKTEATITTTTTGTYLLTYDAQGTYLDEMPIATIKDSQGNTISQVKLKVVSIPGYDIKIEPLSQNRVKIYIASSSGARPLVSGKDIKLDISPTYLTLVNATKASRVVSYSDYSWYIKPDGYLIYQIPVGEAGSDVNLQVNATLPLDFSPAVNEYDWKVTQSMLLKVQPTPSIAGMPTSTVLVVLTILLVVAALYVAFRKTA